MRKYLSLGLEWQDTQGVTAKIVTALAEKGIQILQSADSHTTIWVLVKETDLVEAVNALHSAFELSKEKQLEQ